MRLAVYALKGPNQATVVVLAFAGLSLFLPVVGLLSSATMALVSLRKGMRESLRVMVGAAVVVCVIGAALTGGFLIPLSYGALMWLPPWLVALILREMRQLSWALEAGDALGMLAVALIYGLVSEPSMMWIERFQRLLAPLAERAPGSELTQLQQIGAWFPPFLTGIVAAGSVSSLLISLLLARWWQARLFNPGGFAREFTLLRLHKAIHYLGFFLLIVALVGSAGVSELFWNLLIVVSVLFVILGLSVVHRVLAARVARRFWLAGIYLLALFVPQLLFPVALLGFTDAWADWRNRWSVG